MNSLQKSLLILFISSFINSTASAFMPDTAPSATGPVPQANLTGGPQEAAILTSAIKEVLTNKMMLSSFTDITRMKQLAKEYGVMMGKSALNMLKQPDKKKQKIITYSRTIEDCKKTTVTDSKGVKRVVDVNKEDMVKKAFIKLFFQYPSENSKTKYEYAKKGDDLKLDTTLEMYIIAKEMQKELAGKEIELWGEQLVIPEGDDTDNIKAVEAKLKGVPMEDLGIVTQLKLYERCLVANQFCNYIKVTSCNGSTDEGGDRGENVQNTDIGFGSDKKNEDMVCFWNSAIKAETLYDTIMRYNEFLVAMLAQYRSVNSISNIAKIKEYNEDKEKIENGEDKTSSLNQPLNRINEVVSVKITADVMFADMSAEERDAEEEIQKYQAIFDDENDLLSGDFELSNGAKDYKHVLGTRGDNFDDLVSIAAAEEDLQRAEMMHNALMRLPGYLDLYKTHHYIERLHNISRQMVVRSGECAMNMLKPYYYETDKVWYGPNNCITEFEDAAKTTPSGRVICHYTQNKDFTDTSESVGLMDVACPDNSSEKCYVTNIDEFIDLLSEEEITEEDEENSIDKSKDKPLPERPDVVETSSKGGIMQYLIDFYRAAIDGNALYEYDEEPVITIQADASEGADYSSHVVISSDAEDLDYNTDKTKAAKYMEFYKSETGRTDDEEQTSDAQQDEDDEEEQSSRVYVTERDSIESVDDNYRNKKSDMEANPEDYEGDPEDKSNQPTVKDEESEKGQLSDTQEESIMRWAVGAEVMKDVARDLDFGLDNSGTVHFGKRKRKFPLWNDQIAFYDQYINGKYENMKDYIMTVPTQMLLLNAAVGVVSGLSGSGSSTGNGQDGAAVLQDYFKNEEGQINQMIENYEKIFKQIKAQYEAKIKKDETEREIRVAEKDEAGQKLSKLNAKYNRANRDINEAVLEIDVSQKGLDYNADLYDKANRDDVDIDEMPQTQDYKNLQEKAEAKQEKANSTKDAILLETSDIEEYIKEREEWIEEIDARLDQARREYVKQMSDAEAQEMRETAALIASIRAARRSFITPEEAVTKIVPAEIAATVISCARQYIVEQIEKAQEKIKTELQDTGKIYMPGNYGKLKAIHADLINKISSVSPSDIASCGETTDSEGNSFVSLNFLAGICANDFCVNEDDAFFVGIVGLPHDFAAPHSPDWFTSAPMREVFYFDHYDFSSISKYYKGDEESINENTKMFLSQRLFLEDLLKGAPNTQIKSSEDYIRGEDSIKQSTVPEVWKWILKPHTYVQRSFDLKKLIGRQNGTPEEQMRALSARQSIRRSGLYPCRSPEYNSAGKLSGRTLYDENGKPTGIPAQQFIDVNSDLQYTTGKIADLQQPQKSENLSSTNPNEPKQTYIPSLVPPDWMEYSTVPYNTATPITDVIMGVPECQALRHVNERVFDKETSALHGKHASDWVSPRKASELGNILTYYTETKYEVNKSLCNAAKTSCGGNLSCEEKACKPQKIEILRLTYNNELVHALSAYDEDYGQKGNEEGTSRQNLASRVLLQNNQLGDYLNQIETMRVTADNLINSEKDLKRTQLELAETLIETDFVFGEEFDLANEQDYKRLRDKLTEEKEKAVTAALNKLSEVKMTTTIENPDGTFSDGDEVEAIKERVADITRRALLYQMDSEGSELIPDYPGDLVTIDGSWDPQTDMLEEMQTAKADWDIAQETAKRQDEERERRLQQFARPYCAVYPH